MSAAPRPWLRTLLVVGLVLGFVALLAFGYTRDPKEIPSPLVGRPAPSFSLQLLDGGELRLEDLRGKVVVLNFWASWCYPACWNEAPRLEGAWRRHREHDVVVTGVAYQDTAANARDFVRKHGKTFPNGLDQGTRAGIDYGVYGVPETFFIDREGRIGHKHIGEISERVLEAEIQKLLAEPGVAAAPAGAGRRWDDDGGGGDVRMAPHTTSRRQRTAEALHQAAPCGFGTPASRKYWWGGAVTIRGADVLDRSPAQRGSDVA